MINFRVNRKNVHIWLIGILLSCSAAILAFYNIIYTHYSLANIILTMITAFTVMLCFYINTIDDTTIYIKKNIQICVFFFIIACIILFKLRSLKFDRLSDSSFIFSLMGFFIYSSFSLVYISIWLYRKTAIFLKEIFSQLDEQDKRLYLYISIAVVAIIIIAYTSNIYWYTKYDKVYGLDPGITFRQKFSNPLDVEQDDIRHPILFSFSFPFYAVIDFIADIFIPENINVVFKAITMQIINSQLLLFGGLLLRILTKSKTVFMLYIVSFSTMLYLIIFEKAQLCSLPLILYTYMLVKRPEKSVASLISASGLAPTNFFIVFMELLIKESTKDKLIKFFKIGFFGVLTAICLGNGHLLKHGVAELMAVKTKWGSRSFSVSERFISTLKMYHSSLFELSSIQKKSYTWASPITEDATILSVCILITVIIGIIYSHKELFTRLCTVWLIFSFVFFMVLNWSTIESPIFNIYFAWAIIPMLKKGIDCIFIRYMRINPKIVYGFLIFLMLYANILSCIDIEIFLNKL